MMDSTQFAKPIDFKSVKTMKADSAKVYVHPNYAEMISDAIREGKTAGMKKAAKLIKDKGKIAMTSTAMKSSSKSIKTPKVKSGVKGGKKVLKKTTKK